MKILAILSLINFTSAVIFGFFIWRNNKKNPINIFFGLMSLAIAFWSFFYILWIQSNNQESALIFLRLLSFGAIFIPIFYLHWVLAFLGLIKKKKPLLIFGYTMTLFFSIFAFSPYFVQGTYEYSSKYGYFEPIAGVLHPFYIIFHYLLLFVFGIFYLIKSLGLADSYKQKQIKYIILVTLIGAGGGFSNFFRWYGIDFPPHFTVLVSLVPLTLAYAVSKYKLMNLKLLATQIFITAILITLFVEIFLSRDLNEFVLRMVIFVAITVFGALLIRSALKEIKHREELEVLNEKLEHLDKLKSELLSFASHQVKSPMTVVKGYASLILDGTYGQISNEISKAAKRIVESSDRMIALVENLLDLRKIEEGKMKYDFEKVDITQLVSETVEELKPLTEEKKLDLTFESSLKEMKVKADPQKLRQVIQNLIENSIKYTEKGWVKAEVKKEGEKEILITVSDSGRGISQELLPRLFERFSRDSAMDKKIQGTGLGLYIAKQIIDAHQGKIWAESAGPGTGSSFFVKLPI